VSFGFVKKVEVDGGAASVVLEMSTHNPEAAEATRKAAESAVAGVPGIARVSVRLDVNEPPKRETPKKAITTDPALLPEVKKVIAVASGKGGVGKSTVAANLAVTLAQLGHRVGLLDADIYGPSVPTMFGVFERPLVGENETVKPFVKYGVK